MFARHVLTPVPEHMRTAPEGIERYDVLMREYRDLVLATLRGYGWDPESHWLWSSEEE